MRRKSKVFSNRLPYRCLHKVCMPCLGWGAMGSSHSSNFDLQISKANNLSNLSGTFELIFVFDLPLGIKLTELARFYQLYRRSTALALHCGRLLLVPKRWLQTLCGSRRFLIPYHVVVVVRCAYMMVNCSKKNPSWNAKTVLQLGIEPTQEENH